MIVPLRILSLSLLFLVGHSFSLSAQDDFQPEVWRLFESEVREGQVFLRWQTKLEELPKGFDVERSVDGRNFSLIGKVNGKAKGSEKQQYRYRDPLAVPGQIFYRLRLVDAQGTSSYSDVQRVQYEMMESTEIQINPNPSHQAFTVYFPVETKGKTVVRLLDEQGTVIHEEGLVAGIETWGLLWEQGHEDKRYLLQLVLRGKTYWKWVEREA